MLKCFFSIILLALAGCASCDREDEEYTPFPGGKYREEKPKS